MFGGKKVQMNAKYASDFEKFKLLTLAEFGKWEQLKGHTFSRAEHYTYLILAALLFHEILELRVRLETKSCRIKICSFSA